MTRKPRKSSPRISAASPRMVDFRFDETDYKIDLNANKVYRNWVSVEASRSFTIISAYRHDGVQNV